MKYLTKYYHWRYVRARTKMKKYRLPPGTAVHPGDVIVDSGRYYHHEKMREKYGLKWWKSLQPAVYGLDTTFISVDKDELSKLYDEKNPAKIERNKKMLDANYQYSNAEGGMKFVGDVHTDVTIKYVTVTSKKGEPSTYMVMFRNGVPEYPSWHLLDDKQKKELKEQGIDLDSDNG